MMNEIILFIDSVFSTIGTVLDSVIDFVRSCMTPEKKTEFNAEFISPGKLLFASQKGFCLNGTRSLSIEDSYSNALVLGGSGSGKSSRILIPSILKMMGSSSLVIHDPSGELHEKTSGAFAANGYIVQILNYGTPQSSEGYNPLARVRTVSDIHKISKLIVHNALGQSKDPFWNTAAEGLISIFCRYLVLYGSHEHKTLFNVLFLINVFSGSPEKVDKLIIRTHDATLIADYKAYVAYDNKMLLSIVATARTALAIFSDPSVAVVTSHDTLCIEKFRTQKRVLFINNSVNDMRYYSVISSIFFEQFFGEIMSRIPGKNELPIFFLLDEASSLYLQSFHVTVSNIRKFFGGVLAIYQSYSQIIDMYGAAQARNIAANCYAKVYMAGQPIEVAEELERTLGKFQYLDDKEVLRVRSLRTADEIRQLKESIILCGNQPPICAKMIPYYKQTRLRRLSEIPPHHPKRKLSIDSPPVIQFDGDEKD